MNKFILIFALFLTKLFAYETLDLANIPSVKNIKEFQYCIADKNDSLDFKDILNNENLEQLKKSNLGYLQQTYWCKTYITNSSNEEKSIILSNPRPGMDYIDVFIFKNNQLVKEFYLGDMVALENRSYPSVFNNFELKLKANETSVIISKYKSVGNLEASWIAYDFESFLENESINFILIFSTFGFFFAMMIYKIFIYFHIKDKEYLVYALALACIILSQASLQGTLHYFFYGIIDSFTITLFCWNITHLFLVFLWLFTFYFFNITKKSRFYYPLLIVIYYNILITIFYTLAYIWVDILKFTPVIAAIAFFESILLLLFSLVMYFQKKAGSGYFLMGHFLYIISVFMYILNLQGTVEFSILNHHSTAIGLFLVVLFMSLALSKKFKVIKEENKRQKELIEKNKQFTMIGTTISYVTHQWKQPLSILGAQISSVLAKIDNEPNSKAIEFQDKIYKLENNLSYINNTLSHIKSIFTIKDIKKKFDLEKLIYEIKDNLKEQLIQNNIEIKINNNIKDLTLIGNKNLLSHALNNILQNSIEAFETTVINKTIEIDILKSKKDFIKIIIKDNAGGITIENIDEIFNPEVTTKTFGTGIGLAFTKNIIESKFQGKIEVKNIVNGSEFKINIKINNKEEK